MKDISNFDAAYFLYFSIIGWWGQASYASSPNLLTHTFFCFFGCIETKTGPYLPAAALQIHFKFVRGRSEQRKKAARGAQTVKHLREEQTWPGNFSLKCSIHYILFNLSRHSRSLNTQCYRGRKRGCLDPTARHPWGVKLQIRRVFTSETAPTPYMHIFFLPVFSATMESHYSFTSARRLDPESPDTEVHEADEKTGIWPWTALDAKCHGFLLTVTSRLFSNRHHVRSARGRGNTRTASRRRDTRIYTHT